MSNFPHYGDIISINFDPQSGSEIKKQRPALVVSNDFFNEKTFMAVVCPITSTKKPFPLHVQLDKRTSVQGDIICEQTKSLDYAARGWHKIESAPEEIADKAVNIINRIIGK